MSTNKNKMNLNLNLSFLDMTAQKQDVSPKAEEFSNISTHDHQHNHGLNPEHALEHEESHSIPSTPTGVQVAARLSILPLRPEPPPHSPLQLHPISSGLRPPTHNGSTDANSSIRSDDAPSGQTIEPVVEAINHMNDVEVTDTFYEDTMEFDRRVFGEFFFLDNSSTISTIDTASFPRNTASFDDSFFKFTSTSEARNVEASLAIPTTAHNQELIDWAHRYGILTSSDCFLDLLKVVHTQEDKGLPADMNQRGTKRAAPADFSRPPAKSLCREVPRQLSAAPRRRNGKVDIRLWRRVVQKSVTPIILGAKTAWVQVSRGK